MVQNYNNIEKTAVFTQTLTIQQYSQYLFFLVSLALQKQEKKIILQDITQAYTKSKTGLKSKVIYYLLVKLKKRYLERTIPLVIKPLYGLAKARNHVFLTYLKTSIYDGYLLITKDGKKNFDIAGL